MKEMYGYIRVSTKDQCEERQIIAMHEFGVSDRDIYMDKLSGKISGSGRRKVSPRPRPEGSNSAGRKSRSRMIFTHCGRNTNREASPPGQSQKSWAWSTVHF